MEILVLIKEVPDMEKVRFDSEKGRVDRSSASAELNPFDESALQAALDLKDRFPKACVTVMTMGPTRAEATLKDAYARGADRLVLLTDRKFGGADTCATARALAAAASQLGGFDLILCGEKSVDGDTAQVGAEVAEFLGLPHAYYVEEIIALDKDKVQVLIENLWGEKQKRTMKLPALIGVTKNIATLKLPLLRRKLESLKAPVETMDLNSLQELPEEVVGVKGSPTKVSRIVIPEEARRESRVFREDAAAFAAAVEAELKEKGIL